jgi:type VI secretion system protein ImpD
VTDDAAPPDGGGPPPPDAEPAAPAPTPRTATADGGLRAGLRGDRGGDLDAWLAEPEPALAIAAWFGADLARMAGDRRGLLAALDRDVAAIDALICAQVNAILHARPFQQLEARWRGVLTLTEVAADSPRTKVRLLPASWTELVRDLSRAADFDQSELFDKVYSSEFGMPGGEPFGLIIGDYEVQHRPSEDHPTDDISALKALSAVAAASFAPIILGASPRVLQIASFRELGRPIDIRAIFRQAEYRRWLSLRRGDDMRFIGLTAPRVLMRLPYQPDIRRIDGFNFREETHSPSGGGYLWGSAAFAFGAVVMRAFAENGWFADLRGAPRDEVRGGLVTTLPTACFATDRKGVALKPSLECILSDAHEKDLADLGFIALRDMPFTSYSVFYGNASLQDPVAYDLATAQASSKLSSMLQYVLCVSRFAHYIKVMGRDRLGSLMTAEECESFLQSWLIGYCEGSDNASHEAKARFPLREGRVDVREAAGKPGAYACAIYLRPHFQLDDIATGFRLVTELAPKRAA